MIPWVFWWDFDLFFWPQKISPHFLSGKRFLGGNESDFRRKPWKKCHVSRPGLFLLASHPNGDCWRSVDAQLQLGTAKIQREKNIRMVKWFSSLVGFLSSKPRWKVFCFLEFKSINSVFFWGGQLLMWPRLGSWFAIFLCFFDFKEKRLRDRISHKTWGCLIWLWPALNLPTQWWEGLEEQPAGWKRTFSSTLGAS